MENQKPKQKRSFKFVIRFILFIISLIFVFFASFFITLYINSSTPKENISAGVDLVTDLTESGKKNSASTSSATEKFSEPVKNSPSASSSTEKISGNKKNSSSTSKRELGFFQRWDRLNNIEKAVNEKVYKNSDYVFLSNIPKDLQKAIIAVEDARFYTHDGYDLKGITRAAVDNLEAGAIEEGGSTITQQLAKNLFLNNEQSFLRKAEELLLAGEIEKHYSKDKILEFYLNTIYFGSGYYGISAAAQGYFGKEPKELTLAESAMLAGLPNAPSLYSPYVNFKLAKKRQLKVIDAMLREKVISSTQAEDARIEEIILVRE
mgnify:CR=1 FL=1